MFLAEGREHLQELNLAVVRIEETLATLVGPSDDGPTIAVTAVPDPTRGERVVVVHAPLALTPGELRRGLAESGLPNLFIPAADDFVAVDRLPVTGAGKLDLKSVTQIALDALAPRSATLLAAGQR